MLRPLRGRSSRSSGRGTSSRNGCEVTAFLRRATFSLIGAVSNGSVRESRNYITESTKSTESTEGEGLCALCALCSLWM